MTKLELRGGANPQAGLGDEGEYACSVPVRGAQGALASDVRSVTHSTSGEGERVGVVAVSCGGKQMRMKKKTNPCVAGWRVAHETDTAQLLEPIEDEYEVRGRCCSLAFHG